MNCKKCGSPGNVILRKKDSYCENCFITNTNHKFRACIGKNKVLRANDNVLVCLSGGIGSTVLLDFIHNGISMDSHKKLRIIPFFLHVKESEDASGSQAVKVIEQCRKLNFDVHIINISLFIESGTEPTSLNNIPQLNNETSDKFKRFLKSMPATVRNDLLLKIKRHLFTKYAKHLNCNYILTAETTTTLAINLLSNLALGRGSQIQNEVGFYDARDDNIKVLRPMKEISQEELTLYIKIKNLSPEHNSLLNDNSLQSVIGTFVTDLQENFPATISTICKTADKIGIKVDSKKQGKCVICENELGVVTSKLTALSATKFSRTVSNGRPENVDNFNSVIHLYDIKDNVNQSLFPHIHSCLCYGCSKNYSEMEISQMPNHVQKLFENK
ncbi:cytoplasmic tRNA 2-thiolation protein 2 [Pectinophora gossypiella]|uniref:Cytoplasmic tRNA 2-thiolation protein 2 n=1 Tax=Pectinophora gossypiella TaxID=13191 RepID=A0A1E1WG68_PECGO|nr:cytoplasmic tRNA 2-thiolation protein 2 [Pectinophora gossypiella]XP_049881660.1 cytoplasmic tRNA 2-thiolation protein 2 [Pectinophora gossypiella]